MSVNNETEKSEKKSISFIEQIIVMTLSWVRTEVKYRHVSHPNPTVIFT